MSLGTEHPSTLPTPSTTAAEIAVTGIDWTFAPPLAVATDERWGRTYESFSEDPDLVSELGKANIEGLMIAAGQNLKRLLNHQGTGRWPVPASLTLLPRLLLSRPILAPVQAQ